MLDQIKTSKITKYITIISIVVIGLACAYTIWTNGWLIGMMQITKIGIILLIWYILWAGFRILTGGSDEKAIKQRKKTILRAIISIIIMWFVYAIVLWFISALEGGS